ncbi:hypothetical protein [Amycolatopsis thermoflava]|uniref:hypothetical protein n=1 Tax=Amycolatopsis thermoflava TaxID=84480 RepID=UPI00382B4581
MRRTGNHYQLAVRLSGLVGEVLASQATFDPLTSQREWLAIAARVLRDELAERAARAMRVRLRHITVPRGSTPAARQLRLLKASLARRS